MRTKLAALLVATMFSAPTAAQVVRLGLDAPEENDSSATMDTTGSVAYTVSTRDPFGTNPGLRKQIFRWDTATGSGTQVTSFDEGVESVSVSGDGTWLAFISNADLLGTNHDESPELYVMHPNGTGLAQLTAFNVLPRPYRGLSKAVISGSANRILFTGSIDPFGTNPAFTNALFVIDLNGSNLKQLAVDVGSLIDISDDGSKVIYQKADQLVGINANGSGTHTFTSTAGVSDASLAGNGLKVVYALGATFPATLRVRSFDGNPGTIVNLGPGDRPSITDDGTAVYHRRQAIPVGIYKINSTGGAATLVAAGLESLRISGNGTRLIARNTGLVALDGAGGNVHQLTQATFDPIEIGVEALSADGNRAWYFADAVAGSSDPELFAYDFNTGMRTQLTHASLPAFIEGYFRVSDAGDVFFMSNGNPTNQNPCGTFQIFRLNAAGNVLTQLTSCTPGSNPSVFPSVRGDGKLIVYQLFDGWNGLWRVNADGSGNARITLEGGSALIYSAVSEGSPEAWIAYTSDSNSDGQNPTEAELLIRVKTDGTGWQRITTGPYNASAPSISGDGNRIAWTSQADHTGQNANHSSEVFLWNATTQGITQLTHDQEASFPDAHITRDGAWVFAGGLRISADTGIAAPGAGFLHATSSIGDIHPNATGSSWAFRARDVVDRSPSGSSLYRVQTVAPQIQIGKASPTVVTWDPSPDALRYDVVRGSIGGLAISGSTVDLGSVVCLEDDSPDNHTRGFEDTAIPASGEAFFFLYRGSVGLDAAVGSYGQGTGARERVAAGGCNP